MTIRRLLLLCALGFGAGVAYSDDTVCTHSVDPTSVGETNNGIVTCVTSFVTDVTSAQAEYDWFLIPNGPSHLPYYSGDSSYDGEYDGTDNNGNTYDIHRTRYFANGGGWYEVAICYPYPCPQNNSCSGTDINGYPISNPDYCTYPAGGCSSGYSVGAEANDGEPSNCCEWDSSPIIIDVAGAGFELTDAKDGVMFDLANTGKKQLYSWTAADVQNGWLALDRNGNGMIDSGEELFGTATPQPPSSHPNGYIALAFYDRPENGGNGNGVIDPGDRVYRLLLVWIDSNHNGVSEPSELHHLAELGIEEIGLDYKESRWTDQYGNAFRYKGKITIANDSSDHWAYDVFLRSAH